MVQSAVGDEEDLTARNLAIHHARHVESGLADEIAAELDDQRHAWEFSARSFGKRL